MPVAVSTTSYTKARSSNVLLGAEYQHFDVGSKNAFCFNSGCNGPTGWDEDLSAKGDIVRARLTIKTKGYAFFY